MGKSRGIASRSAAVKLWLQCLSRKDLICSKGSHVPIGSNSGLNSANRVSKSLLCSNTWSLPSSSESVSFLFPFAWRALKSSLVEPFPSFDKGRRGSATACGVKISGKGGYYIGGNRVGEASMEEGCAPWTIPLGIRCGAEAPENIPPGINGMRGNAKFNHFHNSIHFTGSWSLIRNSSSKESREFSLMSLERATKLLHMQQKEKNGICSRLRPLIGGQAEYCPDFLIMHMYELLNCCKLCSKEEIPLHAVNLIKHKYS